MNFNFFAFLNRMKYINRWGLMRSGRQENVQEHSLQVALIAHGLAVIRNRYFQGNMDPNQVAAAAMFHDAGEILTGDMPTPVKYMNPDIIQTYKEIEKNANRKIIGMLPEEMQEDYQSLLFVEDPELKKMIKAADKLSAYIKCLEETEDGNKEFSKAKDTIEQYLRECGLPEVQYFMEHFLKGFTLTLDEMK